MRLFKAWGPTEIRNIASGSAMQCLRLKDRKIKSLVVGIKPMPSSLERSSWEVRGRGGRTNTTSDRLDGFAIRLGGAYLLLPDPFQGMGHEESPGAPEAGQLSRAWTRGCKKTESRKRVSGAKSP